MFYYCSNDILSYLILQPSLQKSTPRKPALSAARSSRRHVEEDYYESEREESEYESDGEDIETSPGVKDKELDYEDDYEEEADEEAAGTNSASEEEVKIINLILFIYLFILNIHLVHLSLVYVDLK